MKKGSISAPQWRFNRLVGDDPPIGLRLTEPSDERAVRIGLGPVLGLGKDRKVELPQDGVNHRGVGGRELLPELLPHVQDERFSVALDLPTVFHPLEDTTGPTTAWGLLGPDVAVDGVPHQPAVHQPALGNRCRLLRVVHARPPGLNFANRDG